MPIAMRRIGPDRMASVLRSVYPRTANFGIAGTCTLGEALKRGVPGAPIENDVRYLNEPIRDFRLGETGRLRRQRSCGFELGANGSAISRAGSGAAPMLNLAWTPGWCWVAGAFGGLPGGWLFYRWWRAVLPRSYSRECWIAVAGNARGMLANEEPVEMLRHYRSLIGGTTRFAVRNMLAVLLGALPITALLLLIEALDPMNQLDLLHRNPFSRYLNDLEFSLLVGATLGSTAAALWSRKRQ